MSPPSDRSAFDFTKFDFQPVQCSRECARALRKKAGTEENQRHARAGDEAKNNTGNEQ
jgi:hypothetical protein